MTRSQLERALEELHPASFGWALSCCRWEAEEARDVLQASYLKVLDGRARFHGESSFKTWLFGVVRRSAAESRRRHLLHGRALLRWVARRAAPASAPGVEALAEDAETARTLRAALRDLPARQREVLHLVFYQDLSVEDAARVLGVSVGSARQHYQRGKQRLRERLGSSR